MKCVILCSFLLSVTCCVFSQSDPGAEKSSDYYFLKSKNQKSGGWLLTIAGTIGLGVTAIIDVSQGFEYIGNSINNLTRPSNQPPIPTKNHRSSSIPYILSAACIGGGIALFVASPKNKRKARILSAYPKLESIPVLQAFTASRLSVPSLAVKIAW